MTCDLTAYIHKSPDSNDDDAGGATGGDNREIVIQIQFQVEHTGEQVSYRPYIVSQTNYTVPTLSEAEMEQANYEHRRQQAIENGNNYNFGDAEADFVSEMEHFAMQTGGANGSGSPQVGGRQYFGSTAGSSNGNNVGSQQDFFEDYEWMVEMDKFDEDTMRQIEKEEDDDLDDMFWWNPDAGCEAAPSTKKEAKAGGQPAAASSTRQGHPSPRGNRPTTNRQSSQHTSNPLSFNPLAQQQQPNHHNSPSRQNGHVNNRFQNSNNNSRNSTRSNGHTFNPLAGADFGFRGDGAAQRNGMPQQQNRRINGHHNPSHHHHQQQQHHRHHHHHRAVTTAPGGSADDLAAAMGGVDINKFNFNPDATSFVPSWLKK